MPTSFFGPGCPSTGCLGGTNLSLLVLKLSSFFWAEDHDRFGTSIGSMIDL